MTGDIQAHRTYRYQSAMSSIPKLSWSRPPQHIAVLQALYLGDLLCATPALRALHRHYPYAEITLIGRPWAGEMIARLPYLARLRVFPGYPGFEEVLDSPVSVAEFLEEERRYGYDLAIQMHGDGSASNGFVAQLGAKVSLGYRRPGLVDDRLTISLPFDSNDHEVLRLLRLTEVLGACSNDVRLEFPIRSDERGRATKLLSPILKSSQSSTGPLIGLHTGAKDVTRRWPPERFAALADILVERYHARVLLTGSADERTITTAVQQAMHFSALDLAGKTDLGTLAAVIQQLDLLITNDTGTSHIAAATRTKSVVLFGLNRPERWAPLDQKRHRYIDAQLLTGPEFEPAEALRQLPLEPVLAKCTGILEDIAT